MNKRKYTTVKFKKLLQVFSCYFNITWVFAGISCSLQINNSWAQTAVQLTNNSADIAKGYTKTNASFPWDLTELFETPKTYPAQLCREKGFSAIFYEGLLYKARRTRVFAYYKAPAGIPPAGGWPAVVCIHGGGGTAFPEWVQAWVDRGYAAIAMDLEGHLPKGTFPNREWHENAGPSRITAFGDIEIADREQWFFHAVADVIKAVSLVASYKEINRHKIGIHGISWGGVIASAVSGIDHRIAFAIPVYGCGFLNETNNPSFKKFFDVMNADQLAAYKLKWDPSLYLPENRVPTLFYIGVNDGAFPLDVWQKSALLVKTNRMLCIPVTSEHGHIWNQPEIFAFADAVTRKSRPLLRITMPAMANGLASTAINLYEGSGKFTDPGVKSAQLVYTIDTTNWQARNWLSIPAQIKDHIATSSVPLSAKAFYFNVTTTDGLTFSSPYNEVGALLEER